MDTLYDVVGYEGLYKINKKGDVWSCMYKKFRKNRINEDGYLKIELSKHNKNHSCFIHRLLAINFIPNPDNLPVIDHIDRDITNNNLNNLQWVSVSANCLNRGKTKQNKSGHKHISTHDDKSNEYWRLAIFTKKYTDYFRKDKYTLEEVVAIRNQKLLELGLPIFD